MRFLSTVLLSCALLSSVRAEQKFHFATTPGKLPKEVVPEQYAIRIVPDLQSLTFSGSETVQIDVKKPVQKLVLNALEMGITAATLDQQSLEKSAIHLDQAEQTLTLDLPNELPAGRHTLALKFQGRINPQGQGLFYARYEEEGSKAKRLLLGTQFEATDARRMFPCWDEPSFRARFQLTAVVPNDFMAVSNMPIEQEKKGDAGKEVRFAETPSMASYLVVLCAGQFDAIESEADGVKLRVVTTKGKAEQGRYALESAGKILHYYNDYFGVHYPLPKLDLIALPGGFGGAMENWGGITYFETALLFDPKASSTSTKQNVFAVIAHEMAHQWFGDLVTMAWWDNLWLNEGFASWMGAKCTDHFNPEWEEWLRHSSSRSATTHYGSAKETAMKSDARSTTHPVQQPIRTEAETGDAFDEITYRKGMSIIRMIESFLGPDVFRDGIRKYIATHKYSNTTTADLWAALTDVSGKPVNEIAPNWTEQPGFPLVKVTRPESATVSLSQERFTVHFPNPPALRWQIPLTYEVQGQAGANSFLLRDQTANLPNEIPDEEAVKLNVNDAGYYRVEYDDASWKALLGQIPNLSAGDRLNLLDDSWALLEAGRKPLALYLDLLPRVAAQKQLVVYDQIIDTFLFLDRLLVGEPVRAQFQASARDFLRPAFQEIGWEPAPNESFSTSLLRVSLIRGLGLLGDEEVIAGCRERFEKPLHDSAAIAPDLRPVISLVVGHYADAATWEKLHQLGRETTSTEKKLEYYIALAGATDAKLARRSVALSLTDELPVSRATALLGYVAGAGEQPGVVWDFAQKHMKALLAKQDALAINSFTASLFNFSTDEQAIEALERYAKTNLPSSAGKAVAKTVDEIGFRVELKQRLLPQLKEWLSQHQSSSSR